MWIVGRVVKWRGDGRHRVGGQVEELDFPVSYEGMEEREPAG